MMANKIFSLTWKPSKGKEKASGCLILLYFFVERPIKYLWFHLKKQGTVWSLLFLVTVTFSLVEVT